MNARSDTPTRRKSYKKPTLEPKGDIESRTLAGCDTKVFGSEDGFFFISPGATIGCS